jgi:GTP-binding protein HflX
LRAGAVAVSAVTGEGCDRLVARLAELVDEGPILSIALTSEDGEGLAWLYRHGRVVERHEDGEGALLVRAKLDAAALSRFERLRPAAVSALAAE